MSSWGEQRDRRDEIMRGDLEAMQRGIQGGGGSNRSGRSRISDKNKSILYCLFCTAIIIIGIVAIVIINWDYW